MAVKRTVSLPEKKGKVSTALPRTEAEAVCYTRPARSARRTYSPGDLKRIYRYVIGSYGFSKATCALLEESGIQELLESSADLAATGGLCDQPIDLSQFAEYVPEGSDEFLGLPPGTVQAALEGCGSEDALVGFATQIRAGLALLIIIWGIWRGISATRLYRFVLRRFLVVLVLFEVLDRLESFIGRLIPVLLILADSIDAISEVCEDDDGENS